MTIHLPELNQLFFSREDSEGDHADDSCCLSLDWDGFPNEESKWSEVRDQHLAALGVMAEYASKEAGGHSGWLLGRPLVFAANHAAELALKTVLLPQRDAWPKGVDGHELGKLLALDRREHGTRRDTEDWENRFVDLLSRAWEAGRYPDSPRREPLFDQWCCVSAGTLVDAVRTFAYLVAQPEANNN
ncbi:HEPN domain-containing protein [Kribbella sp. NPDC056861]|uniref:HEPN domain-containing protein n=1 Tax=Kribbella sp. NPDC056861 TaxID=3154857 RepID=UPI0034310F09